MDHPLVVLAMKQPFVTLEYPFKLHEPGSASTSAPKESLIPRGSFRTIARAMCAMLEGSFYISFPVIVIVMLYCRISSFWMIPLIIIGVRDEMTKRAFGWKSSVSPGLYYEQTEENRQIIKNWDEESRIYKKPRWCWSGDACTLIPFLVNSVPQLHPSVRTWLRVPLTDSNESRGEAIALDWFLPLGEVSKITLIFHGLNGGSSEPYVIDFIHRALKQGNACIVMIARGMQQTPLQSDHFFHGARIGDGFATLQMLTSLHLPVHVVGFSMGAVVLSNILARKGAELANVRSAVAIGGGVDIRVAADDNYVGRGRRVWQPFMVQEIVRNLSRFSEKVEQRIGVKHFGEPMDLATFDQKVVAPYFGFGSGRTGVLAYYRDMSAAPCDAPCTMLMQIKPKLLIIHACDDPIMPIDQFVEAIKTPAENVMYLFLADGGHIGFPIGTTCWRNSWQWQSEAALSFFEAVNKGLK